MVKRFLITTADIRTWKSDGAVLFLGEWCKRYSYKDCWEALDHKTVRYHWDDRSKLYQDYLYLKGLQERIIDLYVPILNEFHNVNYSKRCWSIVIGPWLGFFIQILFDRWESVRIALDEYSIEGAIFHRFSEDTLVPEDMGHFNDLLSDDLWNQCVFQKIIEQYPEVSFEYSEDVIARPPAREIKKPIIKKLLSWWSNVIGYKNKFFFISAAHPLSQMKLDSVLKQCISPYRLSPEYDVENFNKNEREIIKIDVNGNQFESFISTVLHMNIPISYLEGYHKIRDSAAKVKWPINPKVILTNNSYMFDDFFKVWAAEKIKNKALLIVGQHGGHYGAGKWSFTEEHEINISDYYFSWGWKKWGEDVIPVPSDKLSRAITSIKVKKDGGLLQVIGCMPRYSYHLYSIPVSSNQLYYFEDQMVFAECLDDNIKKNHSVRLYPNDYGWDQEDRWNGRVPWVKFDRTTSMYKSISENRLFVGTYNATTILETLASKFPTVLFWNPKHWELRESAEKYYEALRLVGVLHSDPVSAAKHVNEIWDNIDLWWWATDTQDAVNLFCNEFALASENSMDIWASNIRKIL